MSVREEVLSANESYAASFEWFVIHHSDGGMEFFTDEVIVYQVETGRLEEVPAAAAGAVR